MFKKFGQWGHFDWLNEPTDWLDELMIPYIPLENEKKKTDRYRNQTKKEKPDDECKNQLK